MYFHKKVALHCKNFVKHLVGDLILTLVLPRSTDIEAYRQIIDSLAVTENVTLYGLPANIDRVLQRNTSSEITAKLQLIGMEDSQSKRYSKEEWMQKILPILQIWKKISTTTDILQSELSPKADSEPILAFFELVII